MDEDPRVAQLPTDVRTETRLFAFSIGNRTLALDILEGWDYLDPSDPGLASMLEMAFAIFANVLDVDAEGRVGNGDHAMGRAAQYLRSYCDPSFTVEPTFERWETDLPFYGDSA